MLINNGVHAFALGSPAIDTTYNVGYSGDFDTTAKLITSTYGSTVTGEGRVFTLSTWLKRTTVGTSQDFFGGYVNSNNSTFFRLDTTNRILFHQEVNSNAENSYSDATLSSTATWYHIHFVFDSTQAVSADRLVLTINGSVDTWNSLDLPGLNDVSYIGRTNAVTVGDAIGSILLDGLLAETYLLCDQNLDVSNFAESRDGGWYPIEYTGTFDTTHDFYLNYSNNLDLGEDFSGQNNDLTNTNVTQSTTTPTS